jgi:cytoskeletal protein RodZ
MIPDDKKRILKKDLLIASVMVVAGLAMSAASLTELKARDTRMAQATQPLQSSPPDSTTQGTAPAESKPGGERPTTPAPEPAHPNVEAQKDGVKPALPAAPAEKIAEPIQPK